MPPKPQTRSRDSDAQGTDGDETIPPRSRPPTHQEDFGAKVLHTPLFSRVDDGQLNTGNPSMNTDSHPRHPPQTPTPDTTSPATSVLQGLNEVGYQIIAIHTFGCPRRAVIIAVDIGTETGPHCCCSDS